MQLNDGNTINIRVVHVLGQVDFRPSLDSTCRRTMEGKGTRNQLPVSIDRIGFLVRVELGSVWLVLKFVENWKSSSDFAKLCRNLQKFRQNVQIFAKICYELPGSG